MNKRTYLLLGLAGFLVFNIFTLEAAKFQPTSAITKEAKALKDPFAVDFIYKMEEKVEEGQEKAAPPVEPKRYLVLQGIFLGEGTKTAIIDDQVVGAGSEVAGGWKVAEIKSDRVLLSMGGKVKVLKLKTGE